MISKINQYYQPPTRSGEGWINTVVCDRSQCVSVVRITKNKIQVMNIVIRTALTNSSSFVHYHYPRTLCLRLSLKKQSSQPRTKCQLREDMSTANEIHQKPYGCSCILKIIDFKLDEIIQAADAVAKYDCTCTCTNCICFVEIPREMVLEAMASQPSPSPSPRSPSPSPRSPSHYYVSKALQPGEETSKRSKTGRDGGGIMVQTITIDVGTW